jgi:hypothetical protein
MVELPHVLAVADWVVPLISGGSAIVGALAGGSITGYFALKGEKKRQEFAESVEQRKEEREDQATLALARGIGREWARILRDNRATIDAAYKEGYWWPSDVDIQRFTVHEDRKLVASMLAAEGFKTIEIAESTLHSTLMVRDVAREGYEPTAMVPLGDETDRLRKMAERLQAAEQVLRAVGERLR